MDDQSSWKGHSFTMMIFGGIVVLCSIFFILGMLVGRTQGLKQATLTAVEAAAKISPKEAAGESRPELTFYDSVEKTRPTATLEPVPAKPEAPTPVPRGNDVSPANAVTIQVGAFKKSSDAEKQVSTLKKKGFRAFIMAPGARESNPLYRVQIGPIRDSVQAEVAKQKLEKAGYKPIVKK